MKVPSYSIEECATGQYKIRYWDSGLESWQDYYDTIYFSRQEAKAEVRKIMNKRTDEEKYHEIPD
ncbi:MAG: hypothetical protein ACI4BD_06365 [Paludibacteraceae bacterium]